MTVQVNITGIEILPLLLYSLNTFYLNLLLKLCYI